MSNTLRSAADKLASDLISVWVEEDKHLEYARGRDNDSLLRQALNFAQCGDQVIPSIGYNQAEAKTLGHLISGEAPYNWMVGRATTTALRWAMVYKVLAERINEGKDPVKSKILKSIIAQVGTEEMLDLGLVDESGDTVSIEGVLERIRAKAIGETAFRLTIDNCPLVNLPEGIEATKLRDEARRVLQELATV